MEQTHALLGHTMRLSNMVITVDGNQAVAHTYLDGLMMAPDNKSGVNAIGFYDDEIVRTANGWRIARRRTTILRITTVS
jgi:hypothetical protein